MSIVTYKGDYSRGKDFVWKLQNPKMMIHRLRGGSQQPPALPAYIGVTDVTTKSHEHMRVEAFADGQASILADEPTGFNIGENAELRGQSRGWSPVHYQLAGLATCTSITITVVARDQGFKYKGLRTGIRSLIDIRGFFFDLHLQPKFEQINFDLWLDTDESVDRIKALADETDRRCPQLGIYRLAKVSALSPQSARCDAPEADTRWTGIAISRPFLSPEVALVPAFAVADGPEAEPSRAAPFPVRLAPHFPVFFLGFFPVRRERHGAMPRPVMPRRVLHGQQKKPKNQARVFALAPCLSCLTRIPPPSPGAAPHPILPRGRRGAGARGSLRHPRLGRRAGAPPPARGRGRSHHHRPLIPQPLPPPPPPLLTSAAAATGPPPRPPVALRPLCSRTPLQSPPASIAPPPLPSPVIILVVII